MNDPVQVLRSTRHPGQLCPRGLHRSGVTEWDRPHCIIPDRSAVPRPGHPRPLVLHPLPIRIHAAPEGRIEGEGHGFHSATARLTEANWSSNVYDCVPRGTTAGADEGDELRVGLPFGDPDDIALEFFAPPG